MLKTLDALDYINWKGVVSLTEMLQANYHRDQVYYLVENEKVRRLAKGVFARYDLDLKNLESLVVAQFRCPDAVICLKSAARYHGLTTEEPHEVWMARDKQAAPSQAKDVPVRIYRWTDGSRAIGIEEIEVPGLPDFSLKITSAARTVVDLLRFKNKLGVDLGLETLREYYQKQGGNVSELNRVARLLKATNTIEPFVQTTMRLSSF